MILSRIERKGFTLIELLVVIAIIALLLGILVPVLGRSKQSAHGLKEGVCLRNIHAALAMYGAGNKDWFPGCTAAGKLAGHDGTATVDFIGKYYAAATNAASASEASAHTADTTAYAQAVLMEDGGANPMQWLSPGETHVTGGNMRVAHDSHSVLGVTPSTAPTAALSPATALSSTGMVSVFNSSFAVLAYGSDTLKHEWKANQNQQAVVMGSRLLGGTADALDPAAGNASFSSVWTLAGSGVFKGSVVRGDSSTATEMFKRADAAAPFGTLKYGSVTGIPAAAGAAVAGPFAHVAVTTGAAVYGTGAGQVGAGAASGAFVTGQLVSGLN